MLENQARQAALISARSRPNHECIILSGSIRPQSSSTVALDFFVPLSLE